MRCAPGAFCQDAAGNRCCALRLSANLKPGRLGYAEKQILENDIEDLAIDLADYLERIAHGKPLKN